MVEVPPLKVTVSAASVIVLTLPMDCVKVCANSVMVEAIPTKVEVTVLAISVIVLTPLMVCVKVWAASVALETTPLTVDVTV